MEALPNQPTTTNPVVLVVVVVVVLVVVVVVRTWCNAQVSVHLCAQVQLIKKASTSVLASSAGLSSRQPYACCLREQVPGVPKCKLTQPQGEEKDCEARPPHPQLLRRKGGAIFSIASALDAQGLGPVYHENQCQDVSSW